MKLPFQFRPWHRVAFALFGLSVMATVRKELLAAYDISSWAEVSAWALMVLGAVWVRDFDTRFASMIERLFHRGAIVAPDDSAASLLERIEDRAEKNAAIGAVVLPLMVMGVYTYVYVILNRDKSGDYLALKLSLETIAAVMVGRIAGRGIAYGQFGRILKRREVVVKIKLGHPDGAGGLKVVGDFFLFQAGLVFLPAFFFAFWWAMALAWPEEGLKAHHYDFLEWRAPLAVCFLVTLALEVIVFVAPMLFIHRAMVRQKELFRREADDVGEVVVGLEDKLASVTEEKDFKALLARREILEVRFRLLESAPAWPVVSGVRHRFTLGNAAVVAMPLIAKLPFSSDAITETLQNMLAIKG